MKELEINTVTIIGANGNMGQKIAGIFASFGHAKVYLISRILDDSLNAIQSICKSVRADSIADNLLPKDYSNLEECVNDSDLIFESCSENFKIKKILHSHINSCLKEDRTPLVCSGTSGISISELSECYPDQIKKQFFGIHFFNPPYQITLCELILTKYNTDKNLNDWLSDYLTNKLYRDTVVVNDSPCFIANRIGFYFISESLRLADQLKDLGGIDYVDFVLGPFSGRTMPPLITADFVGLDVTNAIIDNLSYRTHNYVDEMYKLPKYYHYLVESNWLGNKSECGLYKKILHNGIKEKYVFDISSSSYRPVRRYSSSVLSEVVNLLKFGKYKQAYKLIVDGKDKECVICCTMIVKYIIYSLIVAKENNWSLDSVDTAIATGFNWCPPGAMLELISSVTDFDNLVKKILGNEFYHDYSLGELLKDKDKYTCKYNYSKFIIAKI